MARLTPSRAMSGLADEFNWIARLRPLTRNDPRALDLLDDVSVLPARPGFDLVITKDAMVEGVHFLPKEAPDVVARRLLRTNLSDLAAKAADPFGYFLMTAWPPEYDALKREAFAQGLADDGDRYNLAILGGDTVATDGPLTVCATMLGWVPQGRAILRSGAKAGDLLIVCGSVGDGWLGLKAARGEPLSHAGELAEHYRLPSPLLGLRDSLRADARACADVSDGLIADAYHLAEASRLGLEISLDRIPLSPGGADWLAVQPARALALAALAAGGDDYSLVCAVAPGNAPRFVSAVAAAGTLVAAIGRFVSNGRLEVQVDGAAIRPNSAGWRH
jgi:thiamine-monophosphate kinase